MIERVYELFYHYYLFAKALGEQLNISPIKVDYLLEGYMGRVVRLATLRTTALNPFFKEYYFTSGRNVQDYYEIKAETEQALKAYQEEKRTFTQKEQDVLSKKAGLVSSIAGQLTAYRKVQDLDTKQAEELRRAILDGIDTLKSIL